jgi:hypothetical protein
MFAFGTDIPSDTFMYMSESSDPYKYAIMTSINCKERRFCVIRDIRYQKFIPIITREYASLESMLGLYVNPCATSLTLYLTTSLFSFCFWMKIHLNLPYPVFIPKPSTHHMHDPGSIVSHIWPKVFTDNQMSQIKYNYYYINSVSKYYDDSQWNRTVKDSITPQERQPGQHVA